MEKALLLVLAALGLVIVPGAAAHAEASPSKVPADSVATITLRIEGEMSVPAVKIAVQLPSQVSEIRLQPAPGWKRRVNGRVVTWSGGKIEEEKFGAFAFSAHMPAAPAGTEIVFPTVQTYANGKVVHWIGAESSDTPAPRVRLTAAKTRQPPPPPVTTTASSASDDDGGITWVVAATLLLAALAAVGAVFWWRRRT